MILLAVALLAVGVSADWQDWLHNFGTDQYVYPEWVNAQRNACVCNAATKACSTTYEPAADELSYCAGKEWLLTHMPAKDLAFLPPASSVQGSSMLDDTLAFAMMADNITQYSRGLPLRLKLAYLLPHTNIMEGVNNYRGLFFQKFITHTLDAASTVEAAGELIEPNVFVNWSEGYTLKWNSSTSPPVVGAYDFIANGYGSCSAWSNLMVATFRSVGIPARFVGSPCWNSDNYAGLATANPNVSKCWSGGESGSAGPVGGAYLWNHNWVEIWDSKAKQWGFINAPPESKELNHGWQCSGFVQGKGCCGGGRASSAGLDHPIFAYTWSKPGEVPEEGGEVLLGSDLRLSSGEAVSPLVWSPHLQDPLGNPISHQLRMVNRSSTYHCDSAERN